MKEFRFITDPKIVYEEKREEDRLGYHQCLELAEVTAAFVQTAQPTSGSDLESHRLQ
jgi:hypothetical protein